MVYLTRKETFNAAHQLWVPSWSEEKNFAVFGKCANRNFHGHNYNLYVTVKGRPDPVIGYIMDAKELGNLIRREITEVLDHTNLNKDPNFLPEDVLPTTENLVICIWRQLQPFLPPEVALHCVKLEETEKISCSYYGEPV